MLGYSMRLNRAIFEERPVKRVRFEYGTIAFYSRPKLGAAVVVSKKVARTAVVRNKIRRRVYRALAPLLKAQTHALVVYPTPHAATVSYTDLVRALEQVL